MAENKRIAKCKQCGDWYCMECSNHYAWTEFCSHECMEENDREKETYLEQQRITRSSSFFLKPNGTVFAFLNTLFILNN
jgi:hypothetical protein